ncbi:zinc finger MYM-type protein 1-like [Tripterygium wilfordii]|uniref:zinc finger MYM-type protein 1-like n=1 Tax=Tripterygium wilfordii TaxID=458696 RepID=UPI0018F83FB3|nr:zinc finger MYM-type protein 1-like [Tripterygium wilfordii]XP_038711480.1 zinc finger MYM-type protein 1-like [Tripterygium wilfordii]XP_038711489.1 zinc finger MYM-type protein 1-like [Tripterygium wilfordii]XP_038711497.1 zinc finger MYM-type protein 1-like [Tripterygium wilfordii]
MDKFVTKVKRTTVESSSPMTSKKGRVEIDYENLPTDLGLRCSIWDYGPNDIDRVRRSYLQKGPCQPICHEFPQTLMMDELRRFNKDWFEQYSDWLEYSVAKDAAYCLYCYLFKPKSNQGGGDVFVGVGFSTWRKKEKFDQHVGKHNSAHNQARRKCQDLMSQRLAASISTLFTSNTNKCRIEYQTRLSAAIDCVRFLLRQGLSFRGHDESELSTNRGNYLELFHWLADHNQKINSSSFENAPKNSQLVSSDIQKDLCIAATIEVTNAIIKDIGEAPITLLVDESRDISTKEQMAVALRYVNKKGMIVERCIGIEHVANTTAISLKASIQKLFSRHKLSLSSLRGQGYDGASNMQGEFRGLKALILNENPCAFYIHYFAYQLQLTLVAISKNHAQVEFLFEITSKIMNIVGASCKRKDILLAKQHDRVLEALKKGEILSGRGLNQEINL